MAEKLTARQERFARLCVEGFNFQDAYIASTPKGKTPPEKSPSTRVQAHRWAQKTAARRAVLAAQKAEKNAEHVIDTSPKSILELMEKVSASLRRAADLASLTGHERLANSIRQSLTRHVGRHNAVVEAVATGKKGEPSGLVDDMIKRILEA